MDQIGIIQEIVNRAVQATEPGWTELLINYHVDEEQSEFRNSYLVSRDGVLREKSLRVANDLDSWLRRVELALAGRPPFTSCKLHVGVDGKFEASYGYEAIDWDALLHDNGWNFPAVTSLH